MGKQSQEYTRVLESLWTSVTRESQPEVAMILYRLADEMSEKEVLWLNHNDAIMTKLQLKYLVERGFLVENSNKDKFSFSHQTLFEFCRAKSLLASNSLRTYVSQRQDSLLVRPTLWSVLKYLRDSNLDNFYREFSRIWHLQPIRLHIQLLMIDFLAQNEEITTKDVDYILAALKLPKLRKRTLGAIAGRPDWLDRIRPIISELMLETPEKAVDLIPILRGGLSFQPAQTLELIAEHWLTKAEYDFIVYQSLDLLKEWSDKPLAILCTAIKRSGLASFYIDNFIQRFFLNKPEEAIEIYSAFFSYLMTQAASITSNIKQDNSIKYSSDNHWLKLASQRMEDPRIQRFCQILDFSEFQTLEEIASLASQQFVLKLWPTFHAALQETLEEPHEWVISYVGDGASSTNLIDDEYRTDQYSFTYAFKIAMPNFAESEPETFFNFIHDNENSDLLVEQRLFAISLLKLVETHPERILDFLLKDPRRFKLGDIWDEHLDTKNLITGIVPQLAEGSRRKLEQAILEWSQYNRSSDDDVSVSREDKKYDRQHRLRLMRAVPERFRSKKFENLVRREEVAFPNLPETTSPRPVISVIEHNDYYQAANGIEDQKNKIFLYHLSEDGNQKLSLAKKLALRLEKLAQDNPIAALKLIDRIPLDFDETVVAKTLQKISKYDSISKLQLIESLWRLENRSFGGPKYAEMAAQLISEIDAKDLDKSILDLLSMLFERSVQPEPTGSIFHKQDVWKTSRSLLWSTESFHTALQPNFFVAQSISQICLNQEPPLANEWITFLNFALLRDQSESLWLGLSLTKLAHIRKANHANSLAFINTLFSHVPIARDSREGLKLIAHLQSWAPSTMVEQWLFAIKRSTWASGMQGFGELLALYHLWFPEVFWAKREMDLVFDDLTAYRKASKTLIGIAHTIAAAWWQPSYRSLSSPFLERLLVSDLADCAVALSSIATTSNSLPKDGPTIHLLQLLANQPKIFSYTRFYLIAQKLEDLLDFCPTEVYLVAQAIASQLKVDLTDYKTEKPIIAGNLVSIAITLQRLGDEHRAQGIDLFESLLEIDVPDAFSALSELDQRPIQLPHQSQHRGIKRKQRK